LETEWRNEFIEEFRHFATQEKGSMWYQSRKICAVFFEEQACNFCRTFSSILISKAFNIGIDFS